MSELGAIDADAVIVGSGPAGSAAAIGLAQSGRSVLVLAREGNPVTRIGESLSPDAKPLLQQLGVWRSFVADGHLPCHGNASSWDTAELRYFDFIHNPHGHAWHLDRAKFERSLAHRAHQLGVRKSVTTVRGATYSDGAWHVRMGGGDRSVTARIVLDATGRSSWFARRQGARRRHDDRQIAVVAFLRPAGEPLEESTSLVEAVSSGWWYSASVPDGRLAMALFTDADLIDRRTAGSHAGWRSLLDETRYTAQRVRDSHYYLDADPRFVQAGSGRLDRIAGEAWAAVGDAAVCYDPLSAHGLTLALAGGRDAAAAVDGYLAGDGGALQAYADRFHQAYARYLRMRSDYYGQQKRWPHAPYWTRRADMEARRT